MNPKFRAVLQRIRDKLHGNTYKDRLQELIAQLECPVPQAELKFARITHLNSEIETELTSARREASVLLSRMVERSLAERRRLGIIFDSLDDAVLIVNSDGQIIDVSGKARQLFGLTTEEFKAMHLCQLFRGTNAESVLAWESSNYFKFLQDHGCSLNCGHCGKATTECALRDLYADYVRLESKVLNKQMHFEHTRQDGTVISIQAVINILTLDVLKQEDLCFIAIVRDLTTHNQTKAEALRLQSFNAGLMSVTPVPVFYKGSDLRFNSVNKSFRDLLNMTDEEVVGKSVHQVFAAASADALHELDKTTLETSAPQQLAIDLKTVKGLVRAVNIFSRVVKINESDSGVAGSIVVDDDVDAKMRSAVFAAAAKAICFVDAANIITGCNDEFLRLVRSEKQSLIGLPVSTQELAPFFHQAPSNVLSDVFTSGDTVINRLCVPIVHELGQQDGGMVYIYFVHFDKTEDTK